MSILRTAGLAARYVSGHLLGEGGTHAWVDVLVPGPAGPAGRGRPRPDQRPRRAGHGYLTIAVGRDYGDVSPTSGTFEAVEYGLSRG